jgi:ribosomal protein S18 acetylase RimI-like enzyme
MEVEYEIRALCSSDFEPLMKLEEEIFGAAGEDVLGPYYVRLCCDFFPESCFVAIANGEIVGYLLCFVRDREAYCTTLGIVPEFQGSRVAHLLLRAFVPAIIDRVDSCWFTVAPDNLAARRLHKTLGAEEVEIRHGFYGAGDERIVSRIDSIRFERLRARYERLGLVGPRPTAVGASA